MDRRTAIARLNDLTREMRSRERDAHAAGACSPAEARLRDRWLDLRAELLSLIEQVIGVEASKL